MANTLTQYSKWGRRATCKDSSMKIKEDLLEKEMKKVREE